MTESLDKPMGIQESIVEFFVIWISNWKSSLFVFIFVMAAGIGRIYISPFLTHQKPLLQYSQNSSDLKATGDFFTAELLFKRPSYYDFKSKQYIPIVSENDLKSNYHRYFENKDLSKYNPRTMYLECYPGRTECLLKFTLRSKNDEIAKLLANTFITNLQAVYADDFAAIKLNFTKQLDDAERNLKQVLMILEQAKINNNVQEMLLAEGAFYNANLEYNKKMQALASINDARIEKTTLSKFQNVLDVRDFSKPIVLFHFKILHYFILALFLSMSTPYFMMIIASIKIRLKEQRTNKQA